MVLNDTSPQSGISNPSSQNGNEPRTYTRGHLAIPGYPLVLKTEYLSRPDLFTLYFGFFGQRNWLQKNVRQIHERIENCKVVINRIPTQEELDAFVEQGSKWIYHQRLGAPYSGAIGMAYAYWRLSNTRQVRHLAPGGVEGKRPSPAQVFGALKLYASIEPANFRSLVVWGGVRWFFWVLTGSLVTSVWGMFHDVKASMADPRLKQFLAEMRENDPEELRRRKIQRVAERSRAVKEAAERRAQGLPPVEVGMGQGQGAEGVYAESQQYDQGGGAYGSLDPYSSSSSRESVPSASPAPDRYQRRSYGDSSAESMRDVTTVDENKATDFFAGDDASPVAAEYQSGGGSQGSAWDRIRQQAGSGSSSGSQGGGSAWNRGPSMPDNERQQRDQAQADFDRLIEAERNMAGDSAGGEKKGWGRWN